ALRTKNAIFTDGSVVKDVKTGTAMVLYPGDEAWEIFKDSQAVLNILSSRASAARWDRQIICRRFICPCPKSLAGYHFDGYLGTVLSVPMGGPRASLGTSVNDSPECDCGTPARKRVKGGVPYYLYKLIVDLKR
ncbi:hypothetical protein FOZ63_030809, partial [Perkinsus olseni]